MVLWLFPGLCVLYCQGLSRFRIVLLHQLGLAVAGAVALGLGMQVACKGWGVICWMWDVSSRLRGVSRYTPMLPFFRWWEMDLCICQKVSSLVMGDSGWSCRATPCLLLSIQLQVVSFCCIGLSFGRRLFPELVWPLHGFSAFLKQRWWTQASGRVPWVWRQGGGQCYSRS